MVLGFPWVAACPKLVFSAVGEICLQQKQVGVCILVQVHLGGEARSLKEHQPCCISEPQAPRTQEIGEDPLSSAGLCFPGAQGDSHCGGGFVVRQLWGRKGRVWGSAEERGRGIHRQPQ